MKKVKTGCFVVFLLCFITTILMYIPIWLDDAETRSNKAKVRELISVGQKLSDAESILRDADFQLLYKEPIAPTYDKSYLQQLVIVGNTQPNMFETLSYASGSWMPFTSNESPYLIINADLDGVITEIE